MIDEEEALERLRSFRDSIRRLSELSQESGPRMDINEIVNAVLGGETESDRELVSLVRAAFQSSAKPMGLLEMARGILAIKKWREVWV